MSIHPPCSCSRKEYKQRNVIVKEKYGFAWIMKNTKGSRMLIFCLSLTGLFMALSAIGITNMIKQYMDYSVNENPGKTLTEITMYAVLVILLYGLTIVLSSVLESIIYNRQVKTYRSTILKAIFEKKLRSIQGIHSGELLTHLTLDVDSLSGVPSKLFGELLEHIFLAGFAVTYLFILNWKLAIILLLVSPLLMIVLNILAPKIEIAKKADLENEETNRTYLQDTLGQLLLFKIYRMFSFVSKRTDFLYIKKAKSNIKLGYLNGLMGFTGNLMGFGLLLIAMGVGAYFVSIGETTVGSLVAMIQLTNYIMAPLSGISNYVSMISHAKASAKRLGGIIDLPQEKAIDLSLQAKSRVKAIELKNMGFSYSADKVVFDDVQVLFERNKLLGIIGESGIGKSTLLKLITGLYEPTVGAVSVQLEDGASLSGIDILSEIAYVPSNNFVFSGSVSENICMSHPIDQQQLEAVAKKANIFDFIQSLPHKFESIIDESGKNISSGQAQRIAIARALYSQAQIILFDEPTANLDAESARLFHQSIRDIAGEKLCIIVTHNKETSKICDEVYGIKNQSVQKIYYEI